MGRGHNDVCITCGRPPRVTSVTCCRHLSHSNHPCHCLEEVVLAETEVVCGLSCKGFFNKDISDQASAVCPACQQQRPALLPEVSVQRPVGSCVLWAALAVGAQHLVLPRRAFCCNSPPSPRHRFPRPAFCGLNGAMSLHPAACEQETRVTVYRRDGLTSQQPSVTAPAGQGPPEGCVCFQPVLSPVASTCASRNWGRE